MEGAKCPDCLVIPGLGDAPLVVGLKKILVTKVLLRVKVNVNVRTKIGSKKYLFVENYASTTARMRKFNWNRFNKLLPFVTE